MGQRILVTVLVERAGGAAAAPPVAESAEPAPAGAVVDTAELHQAADAEQPDEVEGGRDEAPEPAEEPAAEPAAESGEWAPGMADTSEMRLSDILADEDDDPFADLEVEADEGAEPAPQPGSPDPYASLSNLEDDLGDDLGDDEASRWGPRGAATETAPQDDADLIGGYVEGQESHHEPEPAAPVRRRGRLAAVLAWILPILGGAAIGVIIATQIFGLPG